MRPEFTYLAFLLTVTACMPEPPPGYYDTEAPLADTDTDADTDADADTDTDTDTGSPLPSDPISMVRVSAGSFEMGCTPSQQPYCQDGESPAHQVTLSRSFFIGTHEITRREWADVMGHDPSTHTACGEDCPVETVSWLNAVGFANALSTRQRRTPCYSIDGDEVSWTTGLDCDGYRLPTEAEWEFAARGGADPLYAGADELDDVGWYDANSGGSPQPVGRKQPNALGLYDMSGNVWESVWDYSGDYDAADVQDPTGPSNGTTRVCRGGAFDYSSGSARVSFRGQTIPSSPSSHDDLGLRLVRTAP